MRRRGEPKSPTASPLAPPPPVQYKILKPSMWTPRSQIAALLGAILLFVVGLLSRTNRQVVGGGAIGTASATSPHISKKPSLPNLDNCTIAFQPPSPSAADADAATATAKRKPLWAAGYPNAGGPPSGGSFDDVVRGLVGTLTGLPKGHKSYHVSSGSLKRCKSRDSRDVVVTCGCLHPVVPLAPPPGHRTADFAPMMILPIRNPRTNLPAYHNDKAIKYHQQVGQVDISEWRLFRDTYFHGALDQWIELHRSWRDTPYEIAVYLDYDRVVLGSDGVEAGVEAFGRAADALRNSGFPAASSPEDLACAWHQSTAPLRHLEERDFATYVPGYTEVQRDHMITALQAFAAEVRRAPGSENGAANATDGLAPSDIELASLLDSYIADIRINTVLDQAYNETTPS